MSKKGLMSNFTAAVAELEYAYGSKPYELRLMWVQLPPAAQF